MPLSPFAGFCRTNCPQPPFDYANKYIEGLHEFHVPSVYKGEIANGLTKAERQKLIEVGQNKDLILKVLNMLPIMHPYEPLLTRAVEISSQTRSGFYDCLYVALAEQEECELLTADDKLVRNLSTQFPWIRSLSTIAATDN